GGVALFVVVACTWMVMLFVGAAQDYASVVAAFFIGNVLSLVAALGLGGTFGAPGYLGGFTLGQAATLFVLAARVEREFPESAMRSPWPVVRAFRRFASLAIGGLLYNLAISIDRLVFWASPEGFRVRSWFYASAYDAPLFLAYLSVVPALAVFLVTVEMDFYERCRRYYGVVTQHGTLRQVLEAKAGVAKSLRDSLGRLAIVQVPVTLGLILLAPQAARILTLEPIQIAILRAALIGAALHILTMFETIVLLYFDRRRAAAEVAGVFFAGNALFTVASLALGPRFYGHGYAVAGLVACLWAYVLLEQTFEDLEYLTFAGQPLSPVSAST
ncbi:MAG: exopolysaccharide Pel transporter PelG, partial [Candidatus Rokubacteria bacterium]|nr:exopolysaccharide Pel transporter PelG [Candidatus Rokubacteria bacterium]